MSSRRGRRGHLWSGSELKVKEVIMPVKNDQQSAKPSEDDSKDQKDYACKHSITHSSLKLDDEITEIFGLVVLKKPPVEDFVLGTRKKKYKKKKEKCIYPKNNATLCDFFLGTNETLYSKDEHVNDSSGKETFEEKQNLEQKIQNYEKLMIQQQENNYRRQRHLEKQTLEQQENLAETWLGFIQRRKELKNKNLEENVSSISCPLYKRQQYSRPINIFLAPKKYWNDEAGKQISKEPAKPMKRKEKEKAQKALPVVLEGLKDEFFEKLVFVDDSDCNSD